MNKLMKVNSINPLYDAFNAFNSFDSLLSEAMNFPPSFSKMALKSDYFIEDGEITINVDVPGSNREDVLVDFNKDSYLLSVKVAKQYEKKENKPQFYCRERIISNQNRTFQLPLDVDPNSITAEVVNGLLTVKAKIVKTENPNSTMSISVN